MRTDEQGRTYVAGDDAAPLYISTDVPLKVCEDRVTPFGYQQLTSLATAAALSPPGGCRYALIQSETKDVRWRDDGTDPTASVGMTLTAGTVMYYDGNLEDIRFIETAASAKLNVSYYG